MSLTMRLLCNSNAGMWYGKNIIAYGVCGTEKYIAGRTPVSQGPGGGGTSIETLYGDVPPKWVGF